MLVVSTSLLSVAFSETLGGSNVGLAISNSIQQLVFFTWVVRGVADTVSMWDAVERVTSFATQVPRESGSDDEVRRRRCLCCCVWGDSWGTCGCQQGRQPPGGLAVFLPGPRMQLQQTKLAFATHAFKRLDRTLLSLVSSLCPGRAQ